MKLSELIREGIKVIQRNGHHKGSYVPSDCEDPSAAPCCGFGAIHIAASGDWNRNGCEWRTIHYGADSYKAWEALDEDCSRLYDSNFWEWQDGVSQTEVLRRMGATARRLEKAGV